MPKHRKTDHAARPGGSQVITPKNKPAVPEESSEPAAEPIIAAGAGAASGTAKKEG